jgi:SAM-dependent methyltransferase
MTDRSDWEGRVGDMWAEEWRRTDRSLAPLKQVLVDYASEQAAEGTHILDIGCGAGDISLGIAERLPKAQIMGVDISEQLVAVSKSRASDCPNLRFAVADAATFADPAFRPNLLISRHGVMFFANPVAAFTHLRGIAADGARLIFSCFRSPLENEWAAELASIVPGGTTLGGTVPGPFAFADPGHVNSILTAAGWKDIGYEAVDFRYVAGEGDDAIADALGFFSRIGPAARAIRESDAADRAQFVERLKGLLGERLSDGRIEFAAAAWIWTANKENVQ